LAIEIKNLTKRYDTHLVLDNINLTIQKGSIFGLIGPNGAGKSTLVSILNNILHKDSGSIKFFGKDFDLNQSYVKSNSSFIPQTYAFYPDLTTIENLEFFGSLYGLTNKTLKDKINFCINSTSLENYKDKKVNSYSGGIKRRLNIAIGLLNNPKVLYLDEPTVGIDLQSRNYILKMIKQLNKDNDLIIIYTSHYMEEIEYLCDDIAILDNAQIILHEKKDILLKQHNNLEDMFLELTKQDLRD
jgi:ABC-2 type transport system ATP-binding protein